LTLIMGVVVASLNEERFLPRLLGSTARQTRPPARLLLVDDGSDGSSPSVAQRFAERHTYAKLLQRRRRSAETDAARLEVLCLPSRKGIRCTSG
jgi:glycosyltransferase involved in cell wall biosynthesis